MRRRPNSAALLLIALLLLAAALSGCQREREYTRTCFALNTFCTFTVYDEADAAHLSGCVALCNEYERVFSRTREDSELCALNLAGSGHVSEALLDVLELALELYALTDGALDIGLGNVTELWDFAAAEPSPPDAVQVAKALEGSGAGNIEMSGDFVELNGVALDLGAVAKGYIAGKIASFLTSQGVERAMLNLGGNVTVIGDRHGKPYSIGVQTPFAAAGEYSALLELSDASVSTSGVYQRVFEFEGTLYHHVLDPSTGFPADSGLLSVSVTCADAALCDALSTAFLVMGRDAAAEMIRSLDGVSAVFIADDLSVTQIG
ncbi:MAG: FAD:protein FMN transferase [Clostridia bacterium]|nr:FAD:protein FMN transferase [Clostridia bacterium]